MKLSTSMIIASTVLALTVSAPKYVGIAIAGDKLTKSKSFKGTFRTNQRSIIDPGTAMIKKKERKSNIKNRVNLLTQDNFGGA